MKDFPKVKYIKADGNIGYGAANNLGSQKASGEYLLFINPDTKIIGNALDKLTKYLDNHKRVAAVSPSLVDEKGRVYRQVGEGELTALRGIFALSFLNKIFPRNPFSQAYWGTESDVSINRQVDILPGSALMIRKKVFVQIGRFDQNFFLFFEEVDLCKRLKQSGFVMAVVARARVYHKWKASTAKSSKIKTIFTKSRFYYFRKHYGWAAAVAVEVFARLGRKQAILLAIIVLAVIILLRL